MALEFAIRRRIRIAEGVAAPRRRRFRVPAIALPIAAYWLATGVITYAWVSASKADTGSSDSSATPGSYPKLKKPTPRATRKPAAPAPDLPVLPEPTGATAALEEPEPALVPDPITSQAPHPTTSDAEGDNLAENQAPQLPEARLSERRRRATSEPAKHAPTPPPSFERSEPRNEPEPSAPPQLTERSHAETLPSCEAAADTSNQELDFRAARRTADLSRDAFASVLENGTYLSGCAIPERTALSLCVAVQGGKVRGISVSVTPANAAISACVKRSVQRLRFPYSDALDITRTRFDALR